MWVFEVSKKNFKVPFLFTVVKATIQPLGYVWATSEALGYVAAGGLARLVVWPRGLASWPGLVAWPRGLASWAGGHPENDMSTFFQLFGLPQNLHRSNVFELEFCTVVPSVFRNDGTPISFFWTSARPTRKFQTSYF